MNKKKKEKRKKKSEIKKAKEVYQTGAFADDHLYLSGMAEEGGGGW